MRSSFNYDVLKEPRGFIKCIEIFLAVFAFSCATGYRGKFQIQQSLGPGVTHPVVGSFKYPFGSPITVTMIGNETTKQQEDVQIEVNERHSTEFFVVIGVFCFLYSLGVLVYYIVFQEDSQVHALKGYLTPPVIDFVMGAFWAFFWFVSSCAMWAAVTGIMDATDATDLTKTLPLCQNPFSCSVTKKAKYATLSVAIVLGFLNAFVWCGNMWFLWKETPWHNAKNQQSVKTAPPQQQPPQQVPSAI